jgi:hypothetical protein
VRGGVEEWRKRRKMREGRESEADRAGRCGVFSTGLGGGEGQ